MLDTSALGSSPFAALTAVAGPAVLTNASSVLALGTGNRLARVVDRARVVAAELAHLEPGSAQHAGWSEELAKLQVRAELLLQALRRVYSSLGAFAASALLAVVGSVVAYYGFNQVFAAIAVLALGVGAFAVVALGWGCVLMVRETRLAVQNLAQEARLRSGS